MARNTNTLLVLLITIATLLHSLAARPAPQPTGATPPSTAVLESAPTPTPSTGAVTYTVGDNIGWTIPPNGAPSYVTWASGKTFKVGDILVFNFQNSAHDVEEVTKETYDSCNSLITDPLATYENPPVRVTLNMAGPHYFICGVPGHCSVGQKLAINVVANNTKPPTSAAIPPSTSTTPSSPSPPADPPQNSGAASLGNLSLFATMLLSVAAAFFY